MRSTGFDLRDAPDASFACVSTLAAATRAGELSAVEVLDWHVSRIERINAKVNAIVRFDLERARARAGELDRTRTRGDALGPLHGVPFTLKDMHATQGLGASAGTRASQTVPQQNGVIAARLERAGAVLLGKTNMSNSVQTMSEQFGRTSNPYDVRRTSGGSSGGAVASVAAGLSAFDVGTDLSGSIRMPAHFCGVFGLRPTPHRIPAGDMVLGGPGMPRVDRVLGAAGPIARTAEDIGLLLGVLAGPDPSDPEVPPVPVAAIPRVDLRQMRLAVAPRIGGIHIAANVSSAVERLAKQLADAGARVDEREPVVFGDLLAAFRRLFRMPMSLALAVGLAPPGARPDDFREPTPLDIVTALAERDRFIAASEAFFASFDAFICPAATTVAFPHGDRGAPIDIDGALEPSTCVDHPTLWSTYTGCPSLVVPAALDPRGLPIGVQMVGRRWHDENLVGLGAAVAAVTGALPLPSIG